LERNLERLLKLSPGGSQELKELDRWLSRSGAPDLSVETRVEVHHEVSPARRSVRFDDSVKDPEPEEAPTPRSRPTRPSRPRRYSSSCSSSSSSSSEDEADYSLPQRRAYGGVRISYVPNDALALARNKHPSPRAPDDKNCRIS
jgi:hypothetical protein